MCHSCKQIWPSGQYKLFPVGMQGWGGENVPLAYILNFRFVCGPLIDPKQTRPGQTGGKRATPVEAEGYRTLPTLPIGCRLLQAKAVEASANLACLLPPVCPG